MTFYDDDDDDDDATYWSWALIAFIFCGVIGFDTILFSLPYPPSYSKVEFDVYCNLMLVLQKSFKLSGCSGRAFKHL